MRATGEAIDLLQIPLFPFRQTDLPVVLVRSRYTVNTKKGQFPASSDMAHVVENDERAYS